MFVSLTAVFFLFFFLSLIIAEKNKTFKERNKNIPGLVGSRCEVELVSDPAQLERQWVTSLCIIMGFLLNWSIQWVVDYAPLIK